MSRKLIKLGLVFAMILSLVNVSFVQPVKALSGYDNIALNKEVSASSTHSSKNIAYAVDGKVASKQTWQIDYNATGGYNRGNGNLVEEFTIDLGANAFIEEIDITWTATVWAKYVKVEGSFDGVEFFTITEVSDNVISADQEKQIIEFDLTKTKYVKLTFDDPNNLTYGYEFYEVEVYGEFQENLALGKEFSVPSTASTKSAAYLTDGKAVDKETWQVAYVAGSDYNRGNGNTTQSIQLDLGKDCVVNEVDLTWTETVWSKYLKVEGSLDGTEYFTIKEMSDNVISSDKERQVLTFDDTTTRYIKITFDDPNNLSYGYELYEIEVYGVEVATDRIELEPLYEEIKSIPPTINEDGTKLVLPTIPYEDYKVVIYGSNNESVIATDGTIYQPIVDTTVKVSYKIVNVNDETDCYFNDYDEVAIVVPGKYEVTENDNAKPTVLPELREWKGNQGEFEVMSTTKLVIADESLQTVAEIVQFYFSEMLDRDIEIRVGTPNAADIYLTLSDDVSLGAEGYYAEIGEYVTLKAYAEKGLQYAGATIVQILSQEETHQLLPKGIIRDYPAYEVRSMMIDVGRYFIPLDYLEEITKYMTYYKMNEVHVHINENGGEQSYAFRLESKKYPEINSNLDPKHVYSQDAYREYQKEVKKYGIKVVTEIDSPAHAGFLNLYDKSLLLNSSHIDLSDDRALEFMKSLFDEFLDGEDPVIQSDTFHIGVDEYPSEYSDEARRYCDELIKHVNSKGYNTRMWGAFGSSSGLKGTYPVTTDVVCNYWSPNFSDPKQMIADGYAAINNHRTYLYEVPSSDLDRNKFSVTQGWDNWEVHQVPGVTLATSSPMLYGAESAFWYDSEAGFSEFDSWEVLKGMALLIAEKAWYGVNEDKTAKQFEATIDSLGNYAPGANPQRYVESETEEIVNYDFEEVENNVVKDLSVNNYDATLNNVSVEDGALQLNGEGYMSLPFGAKGLNYTLTFDLYLDESPAANTVLFGGEYADGTFYLNYNGTGKLAFVRKDYLFTFNYGFRVGEWNKVTLTCDTLNTNLYVNDIFVGTAVAKVSSARRTTFVLPTEEIGSGVVGAIDNFVLTNRAVSYDEILGFEENAVTNLALNKPTTVSGLEVSDGRFTSDLAVDGDTSTRVSFEKKDDAWFIVDLEDIYWLESIEVSFGEYPAQYQLYVSEDGENWTMIHEDLACSGGTAGTFSISFKNGIQARYVKYQQLKMFTQSSSGRNYSGNFNEFRVYGSKENVLQESLAAAKAILANTEVTTENASFLDQLADSVALIENTLESAEEIKLASIKLQKEIEKFNNGTINSEAVNKDELTKLLTTPVDTSIYEYDAYVQYYKEAINVYVDSDATQMDVDEMVASMKSAINLKNYALNGEIISYNGLTPERMVDGEKPARGNYWDSDGDAQDSSIVVKLTEKVDVEKIVVIPYYYKADYYYNYEVLVSADNENWTSVATYTDKTGKYNVNGQVFEINVDFPVEYVKIQGIESNNANKIHVTELEVYGTLAESTLNKAALKAAIDAADALNVTEEDYTIDSVEAFDAAYSEAVVIYADEEVTQEAIDEVTQALLDAIEGLTPYENAELDKEALLALIESAEEYVANEAKYTVESYATFKAAYVEAVAVAENSEVTQESVDQAVATLDAAMKVLTEKEVVNKDALNAAIATAEAINADDYTVESYANLTAVLTTAKDVAADENATQENVDALVSALNAAIDALAEKPVVTVPTTPTNVTIKQDSYKAATITWDASEGATAYDVYRKSYKEGAYFTKVATVEGTTYTATGLMTGKEYSFYVIATNEAGASDASETVAIATQLEGKPTLSIEKVSKTKFTLSWTEIDGATRYIIYRKRGTNDPWKKILTLGGEDLTYTTGELPAGEYQFIVKAGRYDSKDRVMTGSSNTVTETSVYSKPSITLTAGSKQIKVSWKAIEGVKYYQVYRATSENGKYTLLKTTEATSYTAKSLKSGQKYYFKVRGYKSYNNGEKTYKVYTKYSTVVSVKAK